MKKVALLLFEGLSNIGGLVRFANWLVISTGEAYYTCPVCAYDLLQKGMNECCNCNVKLDWSKVK